MRWAAPVSRQEERMTTRHETEHKSSQAPDETRELPNGRAEILNMDDGAELVAGPGDITSPASGNDAWVVGDDPVVVVDWYGASNYARSAPR
jgi:formylglycine-generating enzyme required for sulfatase activity